MWEKKGPDFFYKSDIIIMTIKNNLFIIPFIIDMVNIFWYEFHWMFGGQTVSRQTGFAPRLTARSDDFYLNIFFIFLKIKCFSLF